MRNLSTRAWLDVMSGTLRIARGPALPALLLVALTLGCASSVISQLAARGDAPGVKHAIEQGADPNVPDYKGRTPVELAVLLNKDAALRELIAGGAKFNRMGLGSRKPVHWAAMRQGSQGVLRVLLEAGVDPNELDRAGQPPLFYAIVWGDPSLIEILLSHGADPSFKLERRRMDLLELAFRYQKFPAMTLLIEAGADPEAKGVHGRSVKQLSGRNHRYLGAIDEGVRRRAETKTAAAAKAAAAAAPVTPVTPVLRPRPTPTPPASKPAPRIVKTAPRIEATPSPPARTQQQIDWGRYYALVIGNDRYQNLPPLQTAVRDAQGIARVLERDYGYQVEVLTNATRSDILLALGRYRETLDTDDNLLIYYAGHGWLDEDADRGYWLPIDATDKDEIFWIPNSSISGATRAMNAKHVMVIADSCYSGKLTRGVLVRQRKPGYLERLASHKARVVLTSGGLEPVQDAGGSDGHSVFASALIQALEENEAVLEGHQLYDQIRRPVALNSDQVPEYSDIRKAGHDGGDFLFIKPQAR